MINEISGSSDSSGLNINYSDTSSDEEIDINLYHQRNKQRKEQLLQEQDESIERIKNLTDQSSPLRQKKVWFATQSFSNDRGTSNSRTMQE
jgi:hypothetical protein